MADIFYFCAANLKERENFVKTFNQLLLQADDRPLVFLCIGTDRATGDCLGPVVGQFLQSHLKKITTKKAIVLGTLAHPVHAGNLAETLEHIHDYFSQPFIIAIDASLGIAEHIGYVTLGQGSLKPGIGVDQILPEVGNIHITGIVNAITPTSHSTLQTTRLYKVLTLSDFISKGIVAALHVSSALKSPQ